MIHPYPQFDALPVGSEFFANGTAYRKTSPTTLVEVGCEEMGEIGMDPFLEARIGNAPDATLPAPIVTITKV